MQITSFYLQRYVDDKLEKRQANLQTQTRTYAIMFEVHTNICSTTSGLHVLLLLHT